MAIAADQLAPAVTAVLNSTGQTLSTTFNAQPSINSVILVPVWSSTVAIDGFAVADNASTPNTYVLDGSFVTQTGLSVVLFRSKGGVLHLPSSGNLRLTLSIGQDFSFNGMLGRSYTGMQFNGEGLVTTFSSGSVSTSLSQSPQQSSELFFTIYNVNSVGATPTVAAPFSLVGRITDGLNGEVGGVGEFISTNSSAQTATWSTVEGAVNANTVSLVCYPPVVNSPFGGESVTLQATKRAGFF